MVWPAAGVWRFDASFKGVVRRQAAVQGPPSGPVVAVGLSLRPDRHAADTPRVLDQVQDKLRQLHDSPRTEEAYIGWIKR